MIEIGLTASQIDALRVLSLASGPRDRAHIVNETDLTESQLAALRVLNLANGPLDRSHIATSVRIALFRRGLVNGAWRLTPAGEQVIEVTRPKARARRAPKVRAR